MNNKKKITTVVAHRPDVQVLKNRLYFLANSRGWNRRLSKKAVTKIYKLVQTALENKHPKKK